MTCVRSYLGVPAFQLNNPTAFDPVRDCSGKASVTTAEQGKLRQCHLGPVQADTGRGAEAEGDTSSREVGACRVTAAAAVLGPPQGPPPPSVTASAPTRLWGADVNLCAVLL